MARISARLVIALSAGAVFAVPLYLVVVNVFKPLEAIKADPIAPPIPFTLANLVQAIIRPGSIVIPGLLNSLVITAASLALTIVIGSMAGYYLARTSGRASHATLLFFLFGLMVPSQVLLVPITIILRAIGLMGTLPGLVLFNLGYYLPFAIFLFVGFIRTIPRELDEAAEIDGAGHIARYWRVIFPLMRPVTATVLIFVGVAVWNDFLNPLIILGPATGTTITVGIYRSIGQFSTDFGQMFAMMFVGALPVLALFLVLQREFIRGLTGGATKG